MVNIGVIGYGYWGPNLVRNFFSNSLCTVRKVVDAREERLGQVKTLYPSVGISKDPDAILKDPEIDGVVIAVPASLHYEIARQALMNDKNVLVEKPLTDSREKALRLIDLAHKKEKVLMVDHTFLYTGAVKKIKNLICSGEIGDIQFFDSVRINLGLFQNDISVVWDLAPHDISILEYLIEARPYSVAATGISHISNNMENIAYITLYFEADIIAHFNVSWTSPVKIRQILIGGTRKMVLYDDLEPTEKVRIYDTGYKVKSEEDQKRLLVNYRVGDIYIPKLDTTEALNYMTADFINAILRNTEPLSNWERGLSVVSILEAAETSIRNKGKEVIL